MVILCQTESTATCHPRNLDLILLPTGSIPAGLGKLLHLKVLNLKWNHLTGTQHADTSRKPACVLSEIRDWDIAVGRLRSEPGVSKFACPPPPVAFDVSLRAVAIPCTMYNPNRHDSCGAGQVIPSPVAQAGLQQTRG